jgi:hypothetical protein
VGIADSVGQLTNQMLAGQEMQLAHRDADRAEKVKTVEKN